MLEWLWKPEPKPPVEITMSPAQIEMLVYDITNDLDVATDFAESLRQFIAELAYLLAEHFGVADQDQFVEDVLKAFE